jgi:SAM-dependent methyltransferase
MPYADERFDVVLMEDVLEHVSDPGRALAECARVLRPGGLAVVKFPSFRMMYAHHLDRALCLPALHYLLPMKTWAAGLNHLLLASGGALSFEPFDEVAPTPFHRGVTRNLNGLDFAALQAIAGSLALETLTLDLVPYRSSRGGTSLKRSVYDALYRLGPLREFLSEFVLYVGRKPAASVRREGTR